MVTKPNVSVRFCVDYYHLNDFILFDVYPMPWVDTLLDQIGGAQVLYILDLTKGYWQILLAKADRPKTNFATSLRLHHFMKMPFGLNGAAASLQRVMD